MSSYSYLTEENVFEQYDKAKSYMESYLEAVDEQERIARNLPFPGLDKAYPKVTDGTTSSIIQKTPRRIIQQLPTGRVVSETNDWLPIVAGFIYSSEIIPNANEDYALIQKCWMMVSRAMAHGVSHSTTPFTNKGKYFGPDLSVPYIKNVYFEAGKLSDTAANCIFLDAWYQEPDIDKIIDNEKKLARNAKARGEKYEGTWDIKELRKVKKTITQKTDKEQSTNDQKNRDDTFKHGVKLTHALQRGTGAIFYTFHRQSEKIVRRKVNKDPRGEMPEQSMYFETDGISPTGRGIVEQVGALQNLMDSEMQMYQYNRALMLNPPLIKKGNFNKSQIKFRPNTIIDLGSDANASVEALTIDTTAIANFPNNYGLMKSQLLNLTASPDTSISSEVGNPGFSKTPAGVNAQQANVSVDDNYIRKQFETWFERWSETAINLYFAERTGVQELQLDNATAAKLRELEESGKLEVGFVSKDNKILIDYDSATEALKFEVDASTSNMKNDQQQLEALDGLLERMQSSPVLAQTIGEDKVVGVWNAIVRASGVEDPEELSISAEELQQRQEEAQMMQQQQMAMEQQAMAMPEVGGGEMLPEDGLSPEMPAEAPQEPDIDDLAFIDALQGMGYSDEQIQQALGMDQQGYSNEEIIEVLEMSNG